MTKDSEKEVAQLDDEKFELNYEAYEKVSCSARLREVRLIASNYSVKPQIFEIVSDLENMDLRFSGECSELDFDEDKGVAFGHFIWLAEVKSGRKNALKLKVEYLLVYSGLKECDFDHISYFFHKVGRFATYPYFRSHFSHNTSETGLVIPPLPTLRERVD